MRQEELYELLQQFKYHLVDAVRTDFEDYETQILSEIRRLNERIDRLELRLEELERDRVHKVIAFEAELLGMTEEEFLRKIAKWIREKNPSG